MQILSASDKKQFALLLSPSWISGLIAVIVGLTLSIGVIVTANYNNSYMARQVASLEQKKPAEALPTPGQTIPSTENNLQNSWPLLLVWGFVGLLIYTITISIIGVIARAKEIRESLEYVHAKPALVLETTAEHVVVRVVASAILLSLIFVFIKHVLPYSITAAHFSATNVSSAKGIEDFVLSFTISALTIHLLAIFLRLSLGKARLFSY